MPSSDYLDQQLLSSIFQGGTFPAPSGLWVALFTAVPAKASSSGTEVSGFGYARQSVAPGAGNWDLAGPIWTIRNLPLIDFGSASGGGWGLIAGAGVYDASTLGNLLFFDALATAKQVDDGDPVVIKIGNLIVGGSA